MNINITILKLKMFLYSIKRERYLLELTKLHIVCLKTINFIEKERKNGTNQVSIRNYARTSADKVRYQINDDAMFNELVEQLYSFCC